MDFTKQIRDDYESLLQDIIDLVAIESVEEKELPGMPFGQGPADALNAFLDMAKDMGFDVENIDNYAGHVDYDVTDGKADDTIGIVGHVDVVPCGDGWICDPYKPEIIDGKLYGRGVIDDKGPIVACLHALKILKDMQVPLSKKVRIIVGANEETGSRCMKYYFGEKKIPAPTLSFTPDAEFPIKNGEMGVSQYDLVTEISDEIQMKAGIAKNSVPDVASVIVPACYKETLEAKLPELEAFTRCTYQLSVSGDDLKIESFGKAAHALALQNGINAITGMMAAVDVLKLGGDLGRIAEFYMNKIGTAIHAENLGVDIQDEVSGKITFNVGKIDIADGKFVFEIDNRVPISYTCGESQELIRGALKGTGFEMVNPASKEKIYMAEDSFLVKTLIDTYREVTGDYEAETCVDGTCTYARSVENCVSYGALLPGQANLMHARNEYVEVDKLETWMKIYIEAIYRLAK